MTDRVFAVSRSLRRKSGLLICCGLFALVAYVSAAAQQSDLGGARTVPTTSGASADNAPAPPTIDWGSCPQLEPNDTEKREKANIIKQCLERIPVPKNITQQSIEVHRAEVAKCALQLEGWFNEHGQYKYEKAEVEIRKKKLEAAIQQQVLAQHAECQQEARNKFPKTDEVIAQIQLYQACMDYHISKICNIQITYAPSSAPQQ
jgi:hypothetical protein